MQRRRRRPSPGASSIGRVGQSEQQIEDHGVPRIRRSDGMAIGWSDGFNGRLSFNGRLQRLVGSDHRTVRWWRQSRSNCSQRLVLRLGLYIPPWPASILWLEYPELTLVLRHPCDLSIDPHTLHLCLGLVVYPRACVHVFGVSSAV